MTGSFLRFQPANPAAGFPAGSIAVLSQRHGDVLGVIQWFPRWRQYVVEPAPETVWSDGCLADLQAEVARLNRENRTTAAVPQAGEGAR